MKKNTVTQMYIAAIMAGATFQIQTVLDKCTVVTCQLPNGFIIVESSACVDPDNYDEALGAEICMKRIENKVWELEGYVLQTNLAGQIAKVCHEANRAYCASIGDNSQPSWEEAPDWQKSSAINGVEFHMNNDTTPEQSHENWMAQKETEGWVYGPVKDPEKKEHPCMVPYSELPIEQRSKDYIFRAIVHAYK